MMTVNNVSHPIIGLVEQALRVVNNASSHDGKPFSTTGVVFVVLCAVVLLLGAGLLVKQMHENYTNRADFFGEPRYRNLDDELTASPAAVHDQHGGGDLKIDDDGVAGLLHRNSVH